MFVKVEICFVNVECCTVKMSFVTLCPVESCCQWRLFYTSAASVLLVTVTVTAVVVCSQLQYDLASFCCRCKYH